MLSYLTDICVSEPGKRPRWCWPQIPQSCGGFGHPINEPNAHYSDNPVGCEYALQERVGVGYLSWLLGPTPLTPSPNPSVR